MTSEEERPELTTDLVRKAVLAYCRELGYYPNEAITEDFDRWLTETQEDAHIEALEGVLGQLNIRENFLKVMASSDGDRFLAGFREASSRVEHATGTLRAMYKNRRRFAARDRAKAEKDK